MVSGTTKAELEKPSCHLFLDQSMLISIQKKNVILVDMCPQANLSEIVLGGNGKGNKNLESILSKGRKRLTVGGYLDSRISSPHQITGDETSYLLHTQDYNERLPSNLWLVCGDPSLEIQAQVISQIGGQTLPVDAWKNVRNWLCEFFNES